MQFIACGAFAEIYRYNEFTVVKRAPTKDSMLMLEDEFTILSKLDHTYIVKPYKIIDFGDHIDMYIPYYPKSLADFLPDLSDLAKNIIFNQLAKAVVYLHKNNIVHRDIKLDNVMMNGDLPVLIDFGLATVQGEYKLIDFVGTPYYSAPELLNHQPYDGRLSDLWSLGVLYYVMVYNKQPYYCKQKSCKALTAKVNSQPVSYPETTNVDAVAKIRNLLRHHPGDRKL